MLSVSSHGEKVRGLFEGFLMRTLAILFIALNPFHWPFQTPLSDAVMVRLGQDTDFQTLGHICTLHIHMIPLPMTQWTVEAIGGW